jgi:hypothetical protein
MLLLLLALGTMARNTDVAREAAKGGARAARAAVCADRGRGCELVRVAAGDHRLERSKVYE